MTAAQTLALLECAYRAIMMIAHHLERLIAEMKAQAT
jgi:hypothetical protein